MTYETQAFGKLSPESAFQRLTIKRGSARDDDVEIDVKYCGICHFDMHTARNRLGNAKYPIVPGHEVAGVVAKVGKHVKRFSVGDHVGVGCMVDSCLSCKSCNEGDEVGCEGNFTFAFNDDIKHGRVYTDSGYTYGGYSERTTINQRFVVKIPNNYPLEAAGPIFCAGITMFSPLKHHGAAKGRKKVGVIGLGGLGQMGIRLAASMGNEVTAISSSPGKEAMARQIGAKHFVNSGSEESMRKSVGKLELVLNTISAEHDVSKYLRLLARRGTIVQLGVVTKPHSISQMTLMSRNVSISGSMIGSIVDTQECMDFFAKNNIVANVAIVTWQRLEEVYDRLEEGNDRVIRYVLDVEESCRGAN